MIDEYDTPTHRASINQLNVDDLDKMLDDLRIRRLARVKQLEELAKVKADQTQLTSWLKFERTYNIAMRAMNRHKEAEDKLVALIHKVRLAAMVVRFEVDAGNDDDDSEEEHEDG